jgi:Tfp pilus assembly protein PilF
MPPDQAVALSERAARQAVSVAPQSGAAHAALATILMQQGKDGYRDAYERAFQLSPSDPYVIQQYAYFLRVTDRPRDALKVFEPLLALDPRNAVVRRMYAGFLDNNGDPGGALAQYRQAIRLEPDGVIPYFRASALVAQFTDRGDLAQRLMRRAASLDPDNAMTWQFLAQMYWAADDGAAVRDAMQQLHRLGAEPEVRFLNAQIALYEARPAAARKILEQLLSEAPADDWSLSLLSTLRGSAQEDQATLDRLEAVVSRVPPEQRDRYFGGSRICLNAWLGHDQTAKELLSRLEPVWRSQPAFGWMGTGGRDDDLARSLACVGRNDDALTELEALLNEGYNIGWRDMAVDPAFDAIRADPRFRAVSDKLKAADAAANARFRARPDLNDADIDSLGS